MTEGNSVRLTTVSSSDLSSRQRAPAMVRVAASSALRMRCSRSAELTMTEPAASFSEYSEGLAISAAFQTRECDALRWCGRRECQRTRAAQLLHRATPPASARGAQSAPPTCRASTCSSASKCRRSPWAGLSARISEAVRPGFCTLSDDVLALGSRDLFQSESTSHLNLTREGLGSGSGHSVFVRRLSGRAR